MYQKKTDKETYQFAVTPQMTTGLGTLSYGVFTTLMTEAANRALKNYKKGDLVVENMTTKPRMDRNRVTRH